MVTSFKFIVKKERKIKGLVQNSMKQWKKVQVKFLSRKGSTGKSSNQGRVQVVAEFQTSNRGRVLVMQSS